MRLFVTGASGYLGGVLLRALEDDPMVESVVGIDVRPPSETTPKLEFHRSDVRDPSVRSLMEGCDAVMNMAFILNEIRDKEETYDININGSKNIFHCCLDAGVPWLIQLSSMAAFGPHPDNPVPLTEEEYPRGAPNIYYSYSKAELEHYLMWLKRSNPDWKVTVLRPTIIIGEGIDNTVAWLFKGRFVLRLKGHDALAQFIHEDDVVSAMRTVLDRGADGVFHITSDDYLGVAEMLERTGMIAPEAPVALLEKLADFAFRLGFSPVSSHWIRMFSYSMVGTSERLKELGWAPTWTSSDLFDEYIVRRR